MYIIVIDTCPPFYWYLGVFHRTNWTACPPHVAQTVESLPPQRPAGTSVPVGL